MFSSLKWLECKVHSMKQKTLSNLYTSFRIFLVAISKKQTCFPLFSSCHMIRMWETEAISGILIYILYVF